MMQALVLLTFVAPFNSRATPEFHGSLKECSCCAVVPDAEHVLFTTGGSHRLACALRVATTCLAVRVIEGSPLALPFNSCYAC